MTSNKDRQSSFKIIFIHGYTASSKADWYPNISIGLNRMGVDFIVPDLPGGERPHARKWLNKIHQEVTKTTKPLVFVGHSLGTRAVLLYLEQYKPRTKMVFLIAPLSNNPLNARRREGSYADFFEHKINLAKIKPLVEKFIVVHSRDDDSVDFSQGEKLASELNAELLVFTNRGHFSAPENAPIILKVLRDKLKF